MDFDKFMDLLNILLGLTIIISLISANLSGILYDDQRQKLEPNYKGNHSFHTSKHSTRFGFSFPFPIFNKTHINELKVITKKYNRAAYLFLISLSIALLEWFINYLYK